MKNLLSILLTATAFLLPALQQEAALNAGNDTTVRGVVFFDRNNNGVFDKPGDKPLQGVAVSNGRDVVMTNRKGLYELPLREDAAVFVIKPRNWMVPVDDRQMPRFYYMHSTKGISGTKFKGLEPTGSLPGSVDFPLYRSDEPDRMDVLVFGDTQARDNKEVYYMSHDVLPGLAGTHAPFGIILGDVAFDDLKIYDHLTRSMATLGIPMWYVAGNHDNDYTGKNSVEARGAWYRTFGPSYYSFSYGSAHFVVLDNIRWIVEKDKSYYKTGLGKEQMEFLKNEITRLDKDQLLVLLAHIPHASSTEWADVEEKKAFLELIASHLKSVSLVAHTHRHYHHFIGKEEGYPGEDPHHMISVGTTCGAWWTGIPDEYGIPHAMMADGTPNSYSFLHLAREGWKLGWRAARRPADFQMHIHAPDSVSSDKSTEVKVFANIFNALPSAEVKMRIGNQGEWLSMERRPQQDPVRLAAQDREKSYGKEVTWNSMGGASVSEHIWEARNQVMLHPGVYIIEVKAKDAWFEYEGRRLLHVK